MPQPQVTYTAPDTGYQDPVVIDPFSFNHLYGPIFGGPIWAANCLDTFAVIFNNYTENFTFTPVDEENALYSWSGTVAKLEFFSYTVNPDSSVSYAAYQGEITFPEFAFSGNVTIPNDPGIALSFASVSHTDVLTHIHSFQFTFNGSNAVDNFDASSHLGAGRIFGFGGDDNLIGSNTAQNRFFGGDGDDSLIGGDAKDVMYGGKDNDTMFDQNGQQNFSDTDTLFGDDGNDKMYTLGGNDTFKGGNGNDDMFTVTGNGNNRMFGESGSDTIFADAGSDLLVGGAARDFLYCGYQDGTQDTIRYEALSDSTVATNGRDFIFQFEQGIDKIDVSRIDARTNVAGNNKFTFIDTAGFSGTSGELRVVENANSSQGLGVRIEADVNGDTVADMAIFVVGNIDFSASDYIL